LPITAVIQTGDLVRLMMNAQRENFEYGNFVF
jgi:hypothetical protein